MRVTVLGVGLAWQVETTTPKPAPLSLRPPQTMVAQAVSEPLAVEVGGAVAWPA